MSDGYYLNKVFGRVVAQPALANQRTCVNCIMDTTDPDIVFDELGVCNHCRHYAARAADEILSGNQAERYLSMLVDEIKRVGQGRPYDCIIGVSGGVDSTYVAWLAKKRLGLRPLAVHFNNGWNSELAEKNIEQTVRTLGIDLYTHVVDWEEFRDLQLSFFKASVSNLEIPTDHAIRALLYKVAARHGLRHILSGSNVATEAIMPTSWQHDAGDLRFLRAIHRQFGSQRLKTFPKLGVLQGLWYLLVKRIRVIPVLNYVDFSRKGAEALIERELGWRAYGAKHGESIFTKFFQRYVQPKKFGFDKRKPHLSNMILSGEISRADAVGEMERPLFEASELVREIEYVAKKFGLSVSELEALIALPPKGSEAYASNAWMKQLAPWIMPWLRDLATMRNRLPGRK